MYSLAFEKSREFSPVIKTKEEAERQIIQLML